jgi:uncharacterized membrane protein YbaN (DUF454 family)
MVGKYFSKGMWLTAAVLFFLLGIAGVLLPILPGFVFFGLSGIALMRSSTRFDAWIRRQAFFQTLRRLFHRHR